VDRKVVANSSVLIFLSKIGLLRLLKELFGVIYIPNAVYREVVIEGGERPGVVMVRKSDWIKVISIKISP